MLREVFPTAPRMTHLITNIAIELEGPDKALTECYFLAFSRREENGEPFDHLSCCRAVDKFEKRDGKWAIAHRRMCWEWGHEMETKETWSRGQTAPDPSALVRGGKKPFRFATEEEDSTARAASLLLEGKEADPAKPDKPRVYRR